MEITPELEQRARAVFKRLNRFMLLMWRLGLGRLVNLSPRWGGQIMVLAHRGRKSGLRRLTPVNYALAEGDPSGDIYCTAGFGAVSDWYKNVRAEPRVEVWLPDGWWAGMAEELPQEDPDWLPRLRQVLIASGFAAPAAGVDPRTLDDAELLRRAAAYRVMRIRRTEARTGPGGPGDLAWVWPLAALLLGLLLVRRRAARTGG